ncbi:serine/threonine protein kinase [Nocardiopsis sp. NPDC058789]|uniref:serine/threonine protein kinase n=1 Tax=Nocardiopsis sp. NPDC058789 TaxID=3346634 RepID=UPI003672A9B6
MSDSAHVPAWAPGYDTSDLLRRGRRARIVRATRTTSGSDVVLKVLSAEAGRAELDQLRQLSGVPGVVPLLDAGSTAEGDMFVVLPFYTDGSFADMLSRMGPAPVQEAAAVTRSVAGALGAVHARGLTHNDVTPGNVLRAGRTPVLTGFGAVCPAGEAVPPPASSTETFLHSPPEALRGEPRGPASDVYQLASTVWTMLVGHAPFASTDGAPFDPHAYAERVFNEAPRPVPRQDVSRKLRGVLNRALAKQPDERYPNAAAFSAAFEQARTSRPATTISATGGNASLTGTQRPEAWPQQPRTGPQRPQTGPQRPPTGPQGSQQPRDVAGPQSTPSGPQHTMSGPQQLNTGPQAPHPPAAPTPDPAPPVQRSDSWFPPESPADPQLRLESAGRLRPPKRELPTPEERERHGAVPDEVPNSTADIMMARLRGEEISPLRAWSRLEGWTGDAESSYLPTEEPAGGGSSDPEWAPLNTSEPNQPRWRRHLHIGVTVCGILLVTATSGVFAATNTSEPVAVAAEKEATPEAAEAVPEPVAAPSSLPEVEAPSGVSLEDTLSTVTLTWGDHTGGTGSYFVLGGRQGHDPMTLARTSPGATTAQVATQDPTAEYCFTVVAVDGGSGAADEVCTTRAAERAAEAERLAEEEAAAEAEEEEEEEDDLSPSPSPSPNSELVREPSPSAVGDGE